MNIHALWCHPRSVSTAFERVMRARGDVDVLHEPFMYHYYLTETSTLFPDFEPEPGRPTTFPAIRDMILERARSGPVFLKDMAYYVLKELPKDTGFMTVATHCFLIRSPAESIVSYHRRDPNMRLEEIGFEAQFGLYQALESSGIDPMVITADDVRSDPRGAIGAYWSHIGLPPCADAFEWDAKVPDDWEAVKGWHEGVLTSGAIRSADKTRDYGAELAALGPRYREMERHHRPFYQALKDIADRQKYMRMSGQK